MKVFPLQQLTLLISMSLLVTDNVYTGQAGHLADFVSLGFFAIYTIQILTCLFGGRVPTTMVSAEYIWLNV